MSGRRKYMTAAERHEFYQASVAALGLSRALLFQAQQLRVMPDSWARDNAGAIRVALSSADRAIALVEGPYKFDSAVKG